MMRDAPSIAMIEIVAQSLEELLTEFVFVGGATIPFYIEDEAIREIRPTEDVDCIVEIANKSDFHNLEVKLRKKGFQHSTQRNAPICRWDLNGVTVDIMPTDHQILGFSNSWYVEGIRYAIEVKLPSDMKISILSLPYFIATKVEAFLARGSGDLRTSHDIEDIVTILDGQTEFSILERAKGGRVNEYLREKFNIFLSDSRFLESLGGHLEPGPSAVFRTKRVLDFLRAYAKN